MLGPAGFHVYDVQWRRKSGKELSNGYQRSGLRGVTNVSRRDSNYGDRLVLDPQAEVGT